MKIGVAFRVLPIAAATIALLAAGFIGARLAQWAGTGPSAGSTAEPVALDVPRVQSIVAEYIATHPKMIVAALDSVRAQQALLEQSQVTSAITAHRAELFTDVASPTMGDPNGDVDVAEFFDFRCPYCKGTAPLLERLVARDHRVRVVFKNLPVLGPDSVYAARLGFAAARRGRFVDFYTAVFARVPAHGNREAIDTAIRSVGLNPAELETQSRTPEIDGVAKRDLRLAEALGITGTPALVIGDQLLAGAPTEDQLAAAVAAARNSPASSGGRLGQR